MTHGPVRNMSRVGDKNDLAHVGGANDLHTALLVSVKRNGFRRAHELTGRERLVETKAELLGEAFTSKDLTFQ